MCYPVHYPYPLSCPRCGSGMGIGSRLTVGICVACASKTPSTKTAKQDLSERKQRKVDRKKEPNAKSKRKSK